MPPLPAVRPARPGGRLAALARQQLDDPERLNSPELPRTLTNLGGIYGTYGRVKDSDETMRAAIAAGERFGLRPLAFSRSNPLYHLYRAGEWDEVIAFYRHAGANRYIAGAEALLNAPTEARELG